jgi:hypothetical protein
VRVGSDKQKKLKKLEKELTMLDGFEEGFGDFLRDLDTLSHVIREGDSRTVLANDNVPEQPNERGGHHLVPDEEQDVESLLAEDEEDEEDDQEEDNAIEDEGGDGEEDEGGGEEGEVKADDPQVGEVKDDEGDLEAENETAFYHPSQGSWSALFIAIYARTMTNLRCTWSQEAVHCARTQRAR